MKNILRTYFPLFILSLTIRGILFYHKIFILKPTGTISPENLKEPSLLGSKAIPSLDVPVASILLYYDTIIGRGYNTVNVDTNITAHAEINAINAALRIYGFEKFKRLDRDHLKLITTFEPCPMCRSVIINCGIQKVEFVKEKPLTHWLGEDLKLCKYEWGKIKMNPENLQDSLFELHPQYNPEKVK